MNELNLFKIRFIFVHRFIDEEIEGVSILNNNQPHKFYRKQIKPNILVMLQISWFWCECLIKWQQNKEEKIVKHLALL